HSDYRVSITGLLDATGAHVPPDEIRFRTGGPDAADPHLVTPPCGLDETPSAVGCVLAHDDRVALRVAVSGPLRLQLVVGTSTAMAVLHRDGAVLRIFDLPMDQAVAGTLYATSLRGRTRRHALRARTTAPLAPVWISEVRADPRGREPAQEYVELFNAGNAAVA